MRNLIREAFDFSGGKVDESGPYPIIRGVLLCGLTSEHGYDYLPAAFNAVLPQYEGIPSYEGHKDGPRQPSEKVGWFRNVRQRRDGRPEADYYLEPDHPLTPRLIRAAKHYPAAFAMSHQAHVNFGDRNGRKVVESFKPGRAIISVDVVDRGGTTGGLFEHAPPLPVKSASPDPWELVREAGDGGMRLTPSRLQALRGIGSRSSRAAFIREQAAIDRQFAAAAVAEQSARASAAGIEAARRRAAQYARQFQEVPS